MAFNAATTRLQQVNRSFAINDKHYVALLFFNSRGNKAAFLTYKHSCSSIGTRITQITLRIKHGAFFSFSGNIRGDQATRQGQLGVKTTVCKRKGRRVTGKTDALRKDAIGSTLMAIVYSML